MKCASCGTDFTPGDQIPISEGMLPASLGMFAPMMKKLLAPHLSRILAQRCSKPSCGGIVSILYLPPAPPAPQGVQTPR